jgi:hypothetical protein
VALLAVGALQPEALPADSIFWADGGTIRRANLDGSGAEVVVTGAFASGVALDSRAGKVYWTSEAAGKIQRANLDGSGVEELLTGLRQPQGIALDLAAGKVYWTEFFPALRGGRIRCANLDGTGVRDLVVGLSFPAGIALESASAKMYWTELEGTVRRARLDGRGVEDLTTLSCGAGIALDGPGGKMYLANCGGGPGGPRIQRANLDGSGLEDLFQDQVSARAPYAVALDLAARKLYWTESGNPDGGGKVRRANLDGTAVEDLVAGGFPTGIALLSSAEEPPAPDLHFRRGDSNLDGQVDISDPVHVLLFLFAGGETPGCEDGADVDDSGAIDLSDAIFILNHLFRGGAAPPAPGPTGCGPDPSPDGLSCQRSPGCAPVTSAELRLLHPQGGERALDLSIFEAAQVEVRITLPAEGTAPAVEVTLESFGGGEMDLTPLYGQLAGTRDQTASVAMAPGRHTLAVRVAAEVAARARFLAFDGSTLAVLHGPDDPAAVLAPEGKPAAHATTILLAFRDDAQDTAISDFLAAHGLVPFGLFVDRLRPGSPRVVLADASEDPRGMDPFALADALNAAAAAGGPLAAAMPDFVIEERAAVGERQTQRLQIGAGVNGGQGYRPANGEYDHSGDNLPPDRFGVNVGLDELDRSWPVFARRSHAAFRLADVVLAAAPGAATPDPVVAVVDSGFGNGQVNPVGFGANENPFLNDVQLARVGIAVPGGGGTVLRAVNVTGGVYAGGDPYLQAANAGFRSALTDANPANTVRDRSLGYPHGTQVAIFAAGDGQFCHGAGGDFVDLLPIRYTLGPGPGPALADFLSNGVLGLIIAGNLPEVDVVNVSWGMGGRGGLGAGRILAERRFFETAMGPLRASGKILTIAAGNDQGRDVSNGWPEAYAPVRGTRHAAQVNDANGVPTLNPLLLCVGATGRETRPTGPETGGHFSNRGDRVSVTAPGHNLAGVDPYGAGPSYPLDASIGTSFAAPQVAGLAGLLMRVDEQHNGEPATAAARCQRRLQVVETIEATADDLGTSTPFAGVDLLGQAQQAADYLTDNPGDGPDDVFGFGRINSLKALLTIVNGGLPVETPTVEGPGFDTDSNNDTDGDGRHDVFRSLRVRGPADTSWYSFELRTDRRRLVAHRDGAALADAGAQTPVTPNLLAYMGVEFVNFAGAGELKSRLPGLVPAGAGPDAQDRTLSGDYLTTWSLSRGGPGPAFLDGDTDPETGPRLELRTAAGVLAWSLDLLEPLLRWGLVPGVRFDDFVFEVTTDRRANDHGHKVNQPAAAASRERVVLAWRETEFPGAPPGGSAVFARVLDANGYQVAGPFRVDQLPAAEGSQVIWPPRVAMTDPDEPADATFVVVWVQAAPTGAGGALEHDLVARAYDEEGVPLGDAFVVDQVPVKKQVFIPGCPGCCTPAPCFAAVLFGGHDVTTREGGYLVVWSDNADNVGGAEIGISGIDEFNLNIRGRLLDTQGAAGGDQFRIAPEAADDDARPLLRPAVDIGPLSGLVAFEHDIDPGAFPAETRIDARLLDAQGTPHDDVFPLTDDAGKEAAPDVAAGRDRFLVVWRDETNDNDVQGGPVMAQFVFVDGEIDPGLVRVDRDHRVFYGAAPSADATGERFEGATGERFVVSWLSYGGEGARFAAVYSREYRPDGIEARYDLDYDRDADDEPDDIRVDRSPPDQPGMILDGPSVAGRVRPEGARGGKDESFIYVWTDTRRTLEPGLGPDQKQDAFFVSWRPPPK